MTGKVKDEELVRLVRDEDSTEAFEELLRRYRKVIYSIAGKIFYTGNIGHATKYEAVLEGESALGLAITRFDRLEGKFKGYSVRCIQGAVLNYVNGNKSLVKPLALQRKLQKVKSVIKALKKEGGEINSESIKSQLIQKYPDETPPWDNSLEDYIFEIINDLNDIELDGSLKDRSLHELIKGSGRTDSRAIMKEAANKIYRIILDAWLKIAKKETKSGNKRVVEVLYRYYVKGESSEDIIQGLDKSGIKGYDYFRQARSRGFRQLCNKYKDIFKDMISGLNRIFEHSFVKDETDEFCNEVKVFFQTLVDTRILAESEDV